MSTHKEKKYAGVWMDHHQAIVISDSGNGDFAVHQKVTANEYHGDKGEHASNNADRADMRKYYKAISHELLSFDEILIFGPGTSQEELRNFLGDDQHYAHKKITLDSAAHVSDNQMIAKVRDFFKD